MFLMYIQLHLLCSECVSLPQGYVVMFLPKIIDVTIYETSIFLIIFFFFFFSL